MRPRACRPTRAPVQDSDADLNSLPWRVFALVAAVAAGFYFSRESGRIPSDVLAAIEQAASAENTDEVFQLVQQASLDLGDARLARVAARIGGSLTLETDPSAAVVSLRRIASDDPSRIMATVALGRTPIAGRMMVAGEYAVDVSADGRLPVTFLIRVFVGSTAEGQPTAPALDQGTRTHGGRGRRNRDGAGRKPSTHRPS